MSTRTYSEVKKSIDALPDLQKRVAYDLIATKKFNLSNPKDVAALQTAIFISKIETNFPYSSAYTSTGGGGNNMLGPWQFNRAYTGNLSKDQQLKKISDIVLGNSLTPSAKGRFDPNITAKYLQNAKTAYDILRAIIAGGLGPIDFEPLGNPSDVNARTDLTFINNLLKLGAVQNKDASPASTTVTSTPIPGIVPLVTSTEREKPNTNAFINPETGKLYDNLSPEVVDNLSGDLNNQIDALQKLPYDSLTPGQKEELNGALATRKELLDAATGGKADQLTACVARGNPSDSWTIKDTPDCEQFNKSVTYKNFVRLASEEQSLPDPCGKSTISKINAALRKFFTLLKGIKKYADLYINGAINKMTDIMNLIRDTASIIGGVLKTLIQRIRNFILNKIRKAIESVISSILNNLAKVLKDVLLQEIVQVIMCKFDDIIKGLTKFVTDFLFALIGNVVNAGFCAAEQFANALINNLAASIDNAIGPVLDSISDVLGGIGKIAGSVFQAIDFILGFESFLCAEPNCPEIKNFKASPWAGPSKTEIDAFSNFKVPTAGGIVGQVDSWVGGLSIFGSKIGDNQEALPSSITCNTGAFRCGPPNVQFFGGGGVGAVGNAVVNNIGQVIGVNLSFGGTGYKTPPFVTFQDSCENGEYASAYTDINDAGEVTRVIMVNIGKGYLDAPNGSDEFGTPINIPPAETKVKTFVACVDSFKVLGTGIGYSVEDSVTITPDAPGLIVRITMNEEGQIIALNIISPSCGLTEVPKVTINSATGAGADIQPILKFYTLDAYNELRDNNYKSQELVQVIDCVYPR